MNVTIPQALALQAMFKHWNRLSSMGSSRMISFYVDGDGDFHPRCNCLFSESIPELTDELEKLAMIQNDGNGQIIFDYDGIAYQLNPTVKKLNSNEGNNHDITARNMARNYVNFEEE